MLCFGQSHGFWGSGHFCPQCHCIPPREEVRLVSCSLRCKLPLHHDRRGAYGRERDVGIFSRRMFSSQLIAGPFPLRPVCLLRTQTPSPYVLVGDESFPLRVNRMRPYPDSSALDEAKNIYNYCRSSQKNFRNLLWDSCCKMEGPGTIC